MPLRAVVFDFDGVIANSEPLHLRAFQEVLAARGVTLTERDYYEHYLGFDDAGAFHAIGGAARRTWTAEDIEALVAHKAVRMEELERNVSILFPGARDAIRRAASRVPVAIASGALGAEIRRVLDRERLTPFFNTIVAAEDTPSGKPAPDPYALALARLANSAPLPPRHCVAIEDSFWGLESARAAGLRTVAVTHTYPADALGTADLIIRSLHDLTLEELDRLCSD